MCELVALTQCCKLVSFLHLISNNVKEEMAALRNDRRMQLSLHFLHSDNLIHITEVTKDS